MNRPAVFLIAAVLVGGAAVGCGGSTRPTTPPALSGQSALDAQATLAVWSAQSTAVVAETRRVEQATADAQVAAMRATEAAAQATADAQAAAVATSSAYGTAVAVEATATAGAQFMAATAQAAQATAAWDALAAEQLRLGIIATATADAAALAFQEEQATKALAARQAEIDRQTMWNRLLPWAVGALAVGLGAALVLLAGTLAVERLRRTRPQQAGDVWVMLGPGGPVALNRPPPQLPARLPRAEITVSEPPRDVAETVIPLPATAMRHCHVLIAGETKSGKSTAMRAVLAPRGRRVTVLDPHYTREEGWGEARVVGAGRDYDAIRDYMEEMQQLLGQRYMERRDGRTSFDPLTVAVDEMPSIVDAVGRDIAQAWRQWLREGRKVGLYLVLSTQSTRVRTLGISGEADLLQNFSFALVLGDVARNEYPAVVNGMNRPAALVTAGRARPVVIPHALNNGRHVDLDGDEDVILLPGERLPGDGPLYVAPTPSGAPDKVDPRAMRPEDEARIRQLQALGWSQRAIEGELFGYNGGAAWEAVRRVLHDAGELPNNHTNGYNPTPGYFTIG